VVRGRGALLCFALALANLGAWAFAFFEFGRDPVLWGTALLAYGLGLRHAVDADHIAAIDSVTRNLMQQGRRPLGVGLYFSLGHSTVVVAACVVLAVASGIVQRHAGPLHRLGGVFGTLVSAGFLFAMALANIAVFRSVYRQFRSARCGTVLPEADLNRVPDRGGLLAALLRPIFRAISRSWHMYPLGVMFGLGFDTASEIGLLGISAAEGTRGLSVAAMLVFPVLFTAAMSLVDTADSLIMLKAYGWAFASPFRRLYYNMAVTLTAALVALVVGGIETAALIGNAWSFQGGFWSLIASASDHFGTVGYAIVGLFLFLWGGAYIVHRLMGYDRLDASVSP
jgi:high-affinity nickel-transport protein